MADNVLTKANAVLGFKVGTQSAFDTTYLGKKAAQAGCFYLTGDTHRLYVGNDDKSVSAVNEGVVTVDCLDTSDGAYAAGKSTLPSTANPGEFYYVTSKNILCVWNGQRWVQINVNVAASETDVSVESVTDGAKVNVKVKNDNGDYTTTDSFSVVGGDNITVSQSGDVITIAGDDFNFKVGTSSAASNATAKNEVKIDLIKNDATTASSSVTLKAVEDKTGNGVNVAITEAEGVVSISAKDSKVASVAMPAQTDKGFKIEVTDNYGDKVSSDVIDPQVKIGKETANQKTVSFVGGVATLDTYTTGEVDAIVAAETKAREDQMKALNAMHYCGTVGGTGTAATAVTSSNGKITGMSLNGTALTFENGDTFMAAEDITLDGGVKISKGSLLIAQGTEGTDGKITSETLTFSQVEGSDHTDTTYMIQKADATGSAVVLHASTGDSVGGIDVNGTATDATKVGITVTPTFTPNQTGVATIATYKIEHDTLTANDTTGTAVAEALAGQPGADATTSIATTDVNVITGVTRDAAGHVTGVETTKVTLKDSNLVLSGNAYSVATANNTATISNTLTGKYGTGDALSLGSTGDVSLTSDNLTVTSTGSAVKMNFEWGEF